MLSNVKKPKDIRDRDREWQALEGLWNSERPELVFAIGRRRVGKSFVLSPFCRQAGGIYFQATGRSENEQLRELSHTLGGHFEDPALLHGAGLPDWDALFRYVRDRAAGERLLLVLDEFPFLAESAPSLPSVIPRFVDHHLPGTRLKLVLAGSWITAMRRLEAADQPLYARRTARLGFAPFSYFDASGFVSGASPADRLRTWGAFGGVPGHLALLDAEQSFSANVERALLDSSSRLYDEAQHMLDGFLGDVGIHYSILEAIASGQGTWGGITKIVGKTAGSISRPMAWLIDMEVVRRVVPVTEKRPERSKRAVYRVDDPYVRFWHRFVAPLSRSGIGREVPPSRIFRTRIAPHLDDWMGPVFEEACREFCHLGGALPFEPLVVGEWWTRTSDGQIDVVASSGDGRLLVGECKWGKVSSGDLAGLKALTRALLREREEPAEILYALFSGRGPSDAALRKQIEGGEVLHFGLDDLFRRPREPCSQAPGGS